MGCVPRRHGGHRAAPAAGTEGGRPATTAEGPTPAGRGRPRHSTPRNAPPQRPRPGSPWYCRSRSTSRKGSAEPRRPAEAAGDTISSSSSSVAAPRPDSGGSGPGPSERRLQLLRAGSWATLIGHAARARPPLPGARCRM